MGTWRYLRGLASGASLALLGVTVPVLGAGAGPASAATIWYVAPGGSAAAPCGMTKATACASAKVAIGEASAGDTIRLARGTYTAATAYGLTVVSKNLTLTGAGKTATILNGNQLGSTLTVAAGVTATVSGIKIEGGSGTAITVDGNPAQAGGGVLNYGTLALANDTVTGNSVTVAATGSTSPVAAAGGGVFNADGGSLTVTGSSITKNAATATAPGSGTAEAFGGGITSDATFQSPTAQTSVSSSTIDDNTVTASCTGAATDCAAVGGGAGEIYSPGQAALDSDHITGNTATATASDAGAAGAGGGGVAEADAVSGDGALSTVVTDNTAHATTTGSGEATVIGGGLGAVTSQDAFGLAGGLVSGNHATATATGGGQAQSEGGGAGTVITITGDAVTNTEISDNVATGTANGANPAGAIGGGLAGAGTSSANAISGSTLVQNKAIADNTGTGNAGSAGSAAAATTSPLVNDQVEANIARATGSGTPPSGSELTVDVIGAVSVATNVNSGSTASAISGSTFVGNQAVANYTGAGAGLAQAVGAAIGGSQGIANSTVNSNTATATGTGTGVPVMYSSVQPSHTLMPLASSLAHAPRQLRARGLGSIAATTKGELRSLIQRLVPMRQPRVSPALSGTIVTTALAGGAGLGALSQPASNTTVSGNTASAISNGSAPAINQGAGIGVTSSSLINDTIAANTATATGPAGSTVTAGGVGSAAGLDNTIIAGNTPTDCGAPTSVDGGGNLDSDGSCGLSAANGSISAGIADLGPLGYNGGTIQTQPLETGSQAIGLGLAATCKLLTGPTGTPDTDERGNPRNSATRGVCDSGAYDTGGTGS